MTIIDWNNLGFDIVQVHSFVKYNWKNGSWDSGEICTNTELNISLYASAFHYGQACFEGLKAFTCKDGKIRIFRPEMNAKRLISSCKAASMAYPSEEIFMEAVTTVVKNNADFVPPYGVNGSMYLRPFVFGSGPVLGLKASDEYTFIVIGVPVGNYYSGGLTPCKALIQYGFDRAAPFGTGHVKLGGNYCPVLKKTAEAKEKGYTVNLFLDSKTGKYVEEFATSNFAALTHPDENGIRTYVTPNSRSVLASITNRSLSELAVWSLGWKVERRPVAYQEILDGKFEEIAACGTAVVLTPIGEIHREYVANEPAVLPKTDIQTLWDDIEESPEIKIEKFEMKSEFDGFLKLYNLYKSIQTGDADDVYGWMFPTKGISH
jgi:branched-chain amino acid aminotransferase